MDHVSNYKPPKDDDKLDEETKRLQTEGCAPKLQIAAEQIKKEPLEGELVDGFRLPQRLPIGKVEIKTEEKVSLRISFHDELWERFVLNAV